MTHADAPHQVGNKVHMPPPPPKPPTPKAATPKPVAKKGDKPEKAKEEPEPDFVKGTGDGFTDTADKDLVDRVLAVPAETDGHINVAVRVSCYWSSIVCDRIDPFPSLPSRPPDPPPEPARACTP